LMPFQDGPALPAWDDKLSLPPSFEEYIKNKDKEKGQD
jgi:general secretion pathway protein D